MFSNKKAALVAIGSLVIAACAPVPRPEYVELEVTGIPENPAAIAMGPIRTIVQDKGRAQIDLNFEVGKQKFNGVMQTIDETVTTNSQGISNIRGLSVGANSSGQTAAIAARTQQQSASTTTVAQGSSKGIASAASDKGLTMSCDYVINNKQMSGAGTCAFSNGAKYRVFSKAIRIIMTDGTSRQL